MAHANAVLLSFVSGVALVLGLLRAEFPRRSVALLGLGLWAAAVFIIHPLTAVMSISGALLLVAVQPSVSWRGRIKITKTNSPSAG